MAWNADLDRVPGAELIQGQSADDPALEILSRLATTPSVRGVLRRKLSTVSLPGGSSYAQALRVPGVASALIAGMAIRVPWGAASVIIVLHVVTDLNRPYAMAGVVATTLGVSAAIGGAWRVRMITRVGTRRVLGPSVAILALSGLAIPWVGYWPLLLLSALSGTFALPTLALVRASLGSAVDEKLRPAVMALDSIAADAAFMLGPACGIAIASWLGNRMALTTFLVTYAVAGLSMWSLPSSPEPTGRADPSSTEQRPQRKHDHTVLASIAAMAFACAIADSAGELSAVAAMNDWDHRELIGLAISGWAIGSIFGGIVFGLLPAPPPSGLLLVALSASLALVAVARDALSFALLLGLNGLFVAPTYAAISSDIAAGFAPNRQAEALSWQAGAMVLGTALGTPAVGWMIDTVGWPSGLLAAAGVGVVALATRAVLRPDDTRQPVQPPPAPTPD